MRGLDQKVKTIWVMILILGLALSGTAVAASAAIVHEGTITGGSTSSVTVATSSGVTAVSGNLYLAAIATKAGSVSVKLVSGLGLTWTLVKAQCAGRNQTRVEVWKAIGTPTGSGVVTATLSATASNAVIAVSRYSGVDTATPIGNVVSANTKGVGGVCSGGVDTASYSLTLTTAVANSAVYGAVAMRNRSHTPGSGYTERAEIIKGSGGTEAGVAVEDRSVATAATVAGNGSFSGTVDWAVVAIEIRPGGGTVNHPPVAQNQSVSTNEDTAKAITLVATDADGDPLTYSVVTQPLHGVLTGTPPDLTYTPNAGYIGADSFSFKANDGKADNNEGTVSITVTPGTISPPLPPTGLAATAGNGQVGLTWNASTGAASYTMKRSTTSGSGYSTIATSITTTSYTDTAVTNGTTYYYVVTAVNAAGESGPSNEAGATPTGGGTGNIVLEEIKTGGSSSSTTVATSAALTGVANNLYLAAIATKAGSVTVKSISGLGLTWTVVKAQCTGRNQTRVEVWKAIGTPTGSGVVTATLSGTASNAVIAVSRYSGVNATAPLGNVASANTKGVNGVCSGGVDSNSYSVSLPSTVSNSVAYGAVAMRNRIHTPGSGYAERAEIIKGSGGTEAGVAVEDRKVTTPATVPVNGSFSGTVDWAVVAIEIRPGEVTVNHPPVAQNQSVTTSEGTAKAMTLVATDADGNSLTYTIVSGPSHGTLSGSGGNQTYTSAAHYYGSDSFTFKANDGKVDSNVATVSITVTSVIRGIITTVAGNGMNGYNGNGGPAVEAKLAYPRGVATDNFGNLYIADEGNSLIRKVDTNGIITSVAGDGDGDCWTEGNATSVSLGYPKGVVIDVWGNLYIADPICHRIRKVDTNGILTTVAGSIPHCCYSAYCSGRFGGDGGPATGPEAALNQPEDVAVDALGNLYIADRYNHRIRKVDTNGIITTLAGNGVIGYGGDGGLASQASLSYPLGVAIDASGNLYIGDEGNQRVRKVDTSGIITTAAGNGSRGYSGDGGLATEAELDGPSGVTLDASGNLYIADRGNHCIRKIDPDGIITTVAGNRTSGYSGDGGPATEAQFNYPEKVSVDALGNLYIGDTYNYRIRKVSSIFPPTKGIIAGEVTDSSTGQPLSDVTVIITDSRNAYTTKTNLDGIFMVAHLTPGSFKAIFVKSGYTEEVINGTLISDQNQTLTIELTLLPPGGDIITTLAGSGARGYGGDGGPAINAKLYDPSGVALGGSGYVYIADTSNHRIRKVDSNGIVTTIAGTGETNYRYEGNFRGDGGPATQAALNFPHGLAVDHSWNLYIADRNNHRIRKVSANGIITTVAGNGIGGYSGDGGVATTAQLWYPSAVALDASGNLYIADRYNNRIRKVDKYGIITTVAGNGTGGYAGDEGLATKARFSSPMGMAVDPLGNLYIADQYNERIRKVDVNGIITTVAGDGRTDYGGDGGPPDQAQLSRPQGVVVDSLGNLFIADTYNDRIRLVMPKNGTITGKVTDSSTSSPLSDVTINIKDSFRTLAARTDSDGVYSISGLNPGSFIATFVRTGYTIETVTGTLMTNETRTLDIQLGFIHPLNIAITSPQDGETLSSSPILVTGNVNNNATVSVNGIQASVSQNAFSVSIPLSQGLNMLTASAVDQYGQTASQTVNVSLITRGGITGIVTDASTNLPLVSATVSITDSSNITKTALTDNTGGYTITDISSGPLNGSITKNGYTAYNFSDTITPGHTIPVNASLNPMLPIISNIQVSGITKDSATIMWTTDQLADSYVDFGISSSYGNWVRDSILTTTHTITLTNLAPGTTYHFKVTSTNGYGFSSSSADRTFETPSPLLTLVITSPSKDAIINRPDVMVKGTVVNLRGNETGVTVNGKLAMVYGTEFVVNHIPLEQGANTIEAIATDTEANTVTTSVVVNGVTAGQYINLTANTESGISPLEVVLTIDSSLNLANASLTYTGPGEAEFLSTSPSEYKVKLTAEGIYYFTVSLNSGGTLYQDSMSIEVLSEAELDALLRGKWEAMRNRLAIGDIEGALVFFDESTKQDYRDLFNVLSTMLPTVAQDMVDIQLIKYKVDTAIFDIRTIRDGVENSFQLLFTKDSAGIWRINSF